MVYVDNAATSFPKPKQVLKEVNDCLKNYCGNPGRSTHSISLKAAEAIYSSRETVARHLGGVSPENIVFTYNATYALNIAIKSIIPHNCHVLTSDFEHNSVIRPLESLRVKHGIEYSCFNSSGSEEDIEFSIRSAIRDNTRAIVCSLVSNVIGKSISIDLLSRIAEEKGISLIIDASQAVGHEKFNLNNSPCDAFCAPGHKSLFGIQGCGFVYFKDKERKESLIEGGSGSNSESLYMPELLPEGYEAGTLSTPAIVSLRAGIEYVEKMGLEYIIKKINYLTDELKTRLLEIDDISIYDSGYGIFSFNYMNYSSSYIASLLDRSGICVRGGLHCAPSIHAKLGTLRQGVVRASFSVMNDIKDVDKIYLAILDIVKGS